MDKKSLILKYFQKASFLTTKSENYCKTISTLFYWLTKTDQVKNDKTTRLLIKNYKISANIICQEESTLAGIEEIGFLLERYTSLLFKPAVKDGENIGENQLVAEISGSSREILSLERTILNILQRMSGIATKTSSLVSLITPISLINRPPATCHLPPFIAATRKTPWGLLDKKAVAAGGGLTHRLDLSAGILVKDNHLALLEKQHNLAPNGETIRKAIETLLEQAALEVKSGLARFVEIEVESKKQALIAIETYNKYRIDIPLAIMFDNFHPGKIKKTLHELGKKYDLSQIIFESSGGITGKNILSYSKTGIDIISLGSLTHSCRAVNFSMEIK